MTPDDNDDMHDLAKKIVEVLREYPTVIGITVLEGLYINSLIDLGIDYHESLETHEKSWNYYKACNEKKTFDS